MDYARAIHNFKPAAPTHAQRSQRSIHRLTKTTLNSTIAVVGTNKAKHHSTDEVAV